MKYLVRLLFALSLFISGVDAAELYSFSVDGYSWGCTGGDYWFTVNASQLGSGYWPHQPVTIIGSQLWTQFPSNNDYLVLGLASPNGDIFTPRLWGWHNDLPTFFPAGTGFQWDPVHTQMHVHYSCASSENTAAFGFTIFYTAP